jgi:hypothetical protein
MPAPAIHWPSHLVYTRHLITPAERNAHFAAVRRRELIRIAPGAFVHANIWLTAKAESRHLGLIHAVQARASERLVFSHHSAAVLWRLPFISAPPSKVHIVTGLAAGGRSNTVIARHTTGVPDTTAAFDEVEATDLVRTVTDIACVLDFGPAVCMADAALRRTSKPLPGVPPTAASQADLQAALTFVPPFHGSAKAAAVVNFANGLADRPGESLSRVSMHRAGITPPQLQVSLVGASGKTYTVDFFWPEFNVIGEFDGRAKYSDPEFLNGRTPEQALLDEKAREDDLRAAGYVISRWLWETAISPALLRAHLSRAGVR